MQIFFHFYKGLKDSFSVWKGLFVIYISGLFLALPVTAVFYFFINKILSNTVMAHKVLVDFYFPFYGQVLNEYSVVINSLFLSGFAAGAVYLLITVFFSGGLIVHFTQKKGPFCIKTFFVNSAGYFWRFLRLVILSAPFFMIILFFFLFLLSFTMIFTENSLTEVPRIKGTVFNTGFFLILTFLVSALFDIAKIITVHSGYKKIFQAFKNAFVWFLRNIHLIFVLILLFIFTGLIMLFTYFYIESKINTTGIFTILILFLWQQLFILGRQWLKVSFLAGYSSLYCSKAIKKSEQIQSEQIQSEQIQSEQIQSEAENPENGI